MSNIILGNLGQDRRKGNGAKVLVNVLDRCLFGDMDDICLFPRKANGAIKEVQDGWGQKVRVLL